MLEVPQKIQTTTTPTPVIKTYTLQGFHEIIANESKRIIRQIGPKHTEAAYKRLLQKALSKLPDVSVEVEKKVGVYVVDTDGEKIKITDKSIDIFAKVNGVGNVVIELKHIENPPGAEMDEQVKYYMEKTKTKYGVLIAFPKTKGYPLEHDVIPADIDEKLIVKYYS